LINLDDIKGRSAITFLENYSGINPYLKKLRNEYLNNKKIVLTETQTKYIIDNHDKEPILINKVIRISPYLGEELQKQNELSFIPEKILIEYILADSEKTYHVYGKLKQNQQQSKMYWLPKTQVLDDPYYEEINIEVDFTKYNNVLAKDGKQLYKHQEEGIKFLLSRNGCILADDMGLGKVLANDTPVLTPYGWVKNGDLKVGDYVIGSNGKPTKILGVYPQPKKQFFNITLTDGTMIESCDEHLWAVQTTNHKKRNKGFIVKELKAIMSDLTYGTNGNVKWYLPIVKPVEFCKSSLNLDPYIMGCLLGDGGFSSHNIRFTSNDIEIISEINKRLPLGHKLKMFSDMQYHLCGVNNTNLVIRELNEYSLMGLTSEFKFIPKPYLYSDIDDRINLLQGLLDTDGYCSKLGTVQYYTVSKELANNVRELVQSLGGVVKMTSKVGKYKLPDGTIKDCKLCFILTINLPIEIIPFKLNRKIKYLNKNKKYHPTRGIKSVEFSRVTTGQCIMVEAKDHLYVMDSYVVTHNTTQSIIAALESGAKNILVVCPSSVKINWKREIEVFCKDVTIVNGRKWDRAKFTIINFDILKNFHTIGDGKKKKDTDPVLELNRHIVNSRFDLAIVDEAHNLKNNKSIRGEIMVDLSVNHGIEKVWLLTGTPIANRPMDFFNLLKIIKAPIADNWHYFASRYCDAKKFFRTLKNGSRKQIWLTDGASNLEELSIKTRNLIIRRLKTDVLDMPDKVITPVYHELSDKGWKEYDMLWDEYLQKLEKENKKASTQRDLVELILLRKFIAMEAIPETIEMTENALEIGKKVIIFTSFTDELNELAEHFGKLCVTHNGVMSDRDKQNSVDSFQNNPNVKVFIGNIKSAGVGITLTEATVVIFNSFDWVTGNNEQAEDRCIFGGQLVMTNNGYKLIEDINIGDMVYTHMGNFKKVVNKHTHLERNKLRYDINAFGYNKELSVTEDHKLFIYDSELEIFSWVEAKNLDIKKHFLTLKSNNLPESRKEYLIINNNVNKTFINSHNTEQINGRLIELPEKIELTNELLYSFGFYIAEGWSVIENKTKSSSVNVCQKITNKKMYDSAEYIIDIIKKHFNIDKHSSYIDKNNVKTCTIYSKNLAIIFSELFGCGVKNKKMPDWINELNFEQLSSLINGFNHGDGYFRKNTQQNITASSQLGSELVRCSANLGNNVSFSIRPINDMVYYQTENSIDNKNGLNRIKKIGEYITYPIVGIHISKPKRGQERVYDLSVEDDNSFVVGNYNVHNCYRIGQKNDVNVYYQLFDKTISTRMWNVLKNKKDIISTIMGDAKLSDDEILEIMIDKMLLENDESI